MTSRHGGEASDGGPANGSLVLPRALADDIIGHARAELPNEACGIVSGLLTDGGGRALAFHATRNEFESPLRYNIHPDDLLRVMKAIEDAGQDVVAVFHSHVASAAVPSETDRRQALYPDAFYLVAGVPERSRPELRAWRIRDGRVSEAPLTIS